MTIKKDQGLSEVNGYAVKLQRRRHLLLMTRAAATVAGLCFGTSMALERKAVPHASAQVATPGLVSSIAPKPEKRSITIATTNPTALAYLPVLVAQHKGFFAQKGLQAEMSEQQSAARSMAAVGNGSADVVCSWLENILSTPGRALGLQSITLLGITPMMALGVLTRPAAALTTKPSVGLASGGINALAQLRGKNIGVVALNSPTHTVALVALRRAGLRASDVGYVSVGSPVSARAALRSGQIDALVHMDPFMLQQEMSGEVQILFDLRSPLASFEALGIHIPSGCVATSQEFLQKFPVTAQACSDALVQALQWLAQASLRDMLHFQEGLPEGLSNMDAQSFVASFERLRLAYSSDGLCPPQLAVNLLQAMHEAEPALRLEKIDALKSINNTLAQRSLSHMKT
jgi:NitT/TauT family transport system substrate-binding protein